MKYVRNRRERTKGAANRRGFGKEKAMLDTLRQWGCDIDAALERFVEDEDFYWECYNILFQGQELGELEEHLNKGEVEDAFICAHGMKGTIGNLGLTPLFELLSPMVEILRAGKLDGVQEQFELLKQSWEEYKTLCK